MLEFIFQGFFEWVYSLILDIWNFFSSSLLNVMTLDFAYIKTHIPIMGDIQQVILAVGWALLLGNLVFQALRSIVSGLGFEGEDPKLLFARTFVFSFLLLVSPQICETVLGMTSTVIGLLEVPDAINVQLVDGSAFGVFTASWLLVIIFDLITMFMVLSLLLEVAERYMVLAMLTVMAPLAFAMGGSKSTSQIFAGWCRMFGSMCFLMASNIIFFKMLLSVVSTVPSFPDVFLWMVLIVSIVKVAKKADEIITRIGLNPAITGSQSTLPGVLAYTMFRTAMTLVTKGAVSGVGGALGIVGKGAAGAGKGAAKAAGTAFKGTGKASGAAAGGSGAAGAASQQSDRPRYGGGRQQNQQSASQQEHRRQTQQTHQSQQTRQAHQSTSSTQANEQQQLVAQERAASAFQAESPRATRRPGMPQQERPSRKSSVPCDTQRAPSYVTQSGAQNKIEGQSVSHSRSSRTDQSINSSSKIKGAKSELSRGGGLSSLKAKSVQPGTTGTSPRNSQRPVGPESRPGRNISPTASTPTSGVQKPSPIQQEQRRAATMDRTSAQGGGPVSRPDGVSSTTSAPSSGTQRSSLVQQEQRRTVENSQTKVNRSSTVSQPGPAGTSHTQRPAVTEPLPGRNSPPSTPTSMTGVQRSGPAQQEQRRTVSTDRPSVVAGGSVPRPDMAGTRSTRRTAVPKPRSGRNIPPATAAPSSGAQRSSPAQQEQRQTARKDKPSVKGGGPVPRPVTAGTGGGHRTPSSQKLSGGLSSTNPTRQTHRKGGEHA